MCNQIDPGGMTVEDGFGVANMLAIMNKAPMVQDYVPWVDRWLKGEATARSRGLR
jgi:hypothetical protein